MKVVSPIFEDKGKRGSCTLTIITVLILVFAVLAAVTAFASTEDPVRKEDSIKCDIAGYILHIQKTERSFLQSLLGKPRGSGVHAKRETLFSSSISTNTSNVVYDVNAEADKAVSVGSQYVDVLCDLPGYQVKASVTRKQEGKDEKGNQQNRDYQAVLPEN